VHKQVDNSNSISILKGRFLAVAAVLVLGVLFLIARPATAFAAFTFSPSTLGIYTTVTTDVPEGHALFVFDQENGYWWTNGTLNGLVWPTDVLQGDTPPEF